MMNPETDSFIHDLFARCDSVPGPVYLTLTAIHPDGDRPTPSRHVLLGDDGALALAVSRLEKANQRGWGAYIGVAPRSRSLGRWVRGSRTDLVCLPALFVDIDQAEGALPRLGWFDLPPSCIIHSGRGYHAYWFLETPTVEFSLADKLLRGLARHLNGDEGLTIAQSMRLPGTVNTKEGRAGALCSLFIYHPERRYGLGEFEAYLPRILPYTRPKVPWDSHVSFSGDLPRAVLDALTDMVVHQLSGRPRSNGYMGALCPLPHQKDRPGMHFSYHPESGWGHCFGKHGKIPPGELCKLLGISVPDQSSAGAA